MIVVSTNIGKRETHQWKGKIAETGIFKRPIIEPIFLGIEDVENDAVVDRKYHGGIDQAVYAYSENHYEYWKKLYPHLDFNFGMFGENLTISDLDETTICVGDVYKIGNALIEVTKPREPCFKLIFRFQDEAIVKQFWDSTYSGVYFKVLQIGAVQTGDDFKLVQESSETRITIAEIYKNLSK
ncbi:MAG: MOSC domain-containing protein [Flavobacteriaceae bacterium]|nr:MOSC domain-containing protein [Flavobacteriaceae bacterium]